MFELSRLQESIASLGGAVLAFSGGVDSTLLAKAAADCLAPGRLLAVTAQSPLRPQREVREAEALASLLRLEHRVIGTDELELAEVAGNGRDRCYQCKRILFAGLREIASERGLPHVIDGTNADEARAHRPGLRAAAEFNVRSPLAEVGLTKAVIRKLSCALGLPNWDRPAFSCLATRFPYGTPLNAERLDRVERGEALLHGLGIKECRLRDHGEVARLETAPVEFERALAARGEIASGLRALGYAHIALDLEGYRSGSYDREQDGSV